jgi:hypothetical protein
MGWLGVLAAAVFFTLAIVMPGSSTGAVLFLLLMAMISLFWGAFRLLQDRLGGQSRSDLEMISPAEMRAWREQAEARKQAAAKGEATP